MLDLENPQIMYLSNESRQPQVEVSPTLTTVGSTVVVAPPPHSPPRAFKCTIEHQVSTRTTTSKKDTTTSKSIGKESRRLLLFGMVGKPLIALIVTTVLATTGSAAWLFTEWLTIPGLEEQIRALEQQVHQLSHENDRYALLNSQLNETTTEYNLLNIQLNESSTQLSNLNQELNNSNNVFANLNAELHSQNLLYASLNAELNETTKELSSLNQDLMTIVTFLNDTSTALQYNLEALIEYLADQIAIYQVLVVETLRNTYQQRIQNWDCAYRDHFLTENFIRNRTHPIGPEMLPEVMDYVEQRLLRDLCLDQMNLEFYLTMSTTANSLDQITSNELVQGISRYTSLAMTHYFPDDTTTTTMIGRKGSGVTVEEWAAASYRCSNLKRPFLWN